MENVNNVQGLWELLTANGLAGIVLGIGIFLIVLLGRYSGFVKNGNWARISAAISGLMLGGASLGAVDNNVTTIVGILVAGLVHELKDFIDKKKKPS